MTDRKNCGTKEYYVKSEYEKEIEFMTQKNGIDMLQWRKWSDSEPQYRKWYNLLVLELTRLQEIYNKRGNIETITLKRIFPYGIKVKEDHAPIIIPQEYESFGDKIAYFLTMIPSNRHFWHLLSFKDKIEFYEFISNNINYKLLHMAAYSYDLGNLLDDIIRYVINIEDPMFIKYCEASKENKKRMAQYSSTDDLVLESLPEILQKSLIPFSLFRFENLSNKYEGKEYKFYEFRPIDKDLPRVSTGQYVFSTITPKGTVGY